MKLAREEAEERSREHRIRELRRVEAEQRARLEEQRISYLEQKLRQHQERDRLRRFVDGLDDGSAEIAEFLKWAQQRLTQLTEAISSTTIAAEISKLEAFRVLAAANDAEQASGGEQG